jgi:hypothetical protein
MGNAFLAEQKLSFIILSAKSDYWCANSFGLKRATTASAQRWGEGGAFFAGLKICLKINHAMKSSLKMKF